MFSNRLMFGARAVAGVAAAGAGGYFASRQNTVSAPAATVASSVPAAEAAALNHPVQETEAIVGETVPKAVVAPAETSRRAKPARTTPTAPTRSASTTAPQNLPALERSWPTSTSSQSPTDSFPSLPAASADSNAAAAPVEDSAPLESPRAPEPPQKVFDELVVSANSVMGLETENRISSETARIEDRVEAKVTRDVKVGDPIAIPAGSRAIGAVIQVERGGKFKERARLGIRFTTLVLADGTRLPVSTETVYREGEAPG